MQQSSEIWTDVGGICLLRKHQHILSSPTEWLDDDLIAAAQHLLKKRHPAVEGLQPPAVALTGTMQQQMAAEFVQILFAKGNHWIVVSTLHQSAPGSINVYNSLNSKSLHSAVEETALRYLQGQQVSISYQDVQQQSGGSDCGLFAIAIAASLCAGEDPTKLRYQQDRMRQHFRNCLENGEITPFPVN